MKLLSPKAASDRIGCSRAHIYNLVRDRRLRRYYIGADGKSVLRVAEEDVERYIAEAECPPEDGAA